jgi:2'-5' RNA ligase
VAETAIVVVVPEAQAAVDLPRRRYTVDGAEGMPPHITLLYPFLDTDLLVPRRIGEVKEALTAFPPFDGELAEVARFEQSVDSVLWLAPRPAERLVAITEALVRAFPDHPPYAGAYETTVPHLTVAMSEDGDVLAEIEADLVKKMPIAMRVGSVAIFAHAAKRWKLLTRIPL